VSVRFKWTGLCCLCSSRVKLHLVSIYHSMHTRRLNIHCRACKLSHVLAAVHASHRDCSLGSCVTCELSHLCLILAHWKVCLCCSASLVDGSSIKCVCCFFFSIVITKGNGFSHSRNLQGCKGLVSFDRSHSTNACCMLPVQQHSHEESACFKSSTVNLHKPNVVLGYRAQWTLKSSSKTAIKAEG
jgi:hypothetical protein